MHYLTTIYLHSIIHLSKINNPSITYMLIITHLSTYPSNSPIFHVLTKSTHPTTHPPIQPSPHPSIISVWGCITGRVMPTWIGHSPSSQGSIQGETHPILREWSVVGGQRRGPFLIVSRDARWHLRIDGWLRPGSSQRSDGRTDTQRIQHLGQWELFLLWWEAMNVSPEVAWVPGLSVWTLGSWRYSWVPKDRSLPLDLVLFPWVESRVALGLGSLFLRLK